MSPCVRAALAWLLCVLVSIAGSQRMASCDDAHRAAGGCGAAGGCCCDGAQKAACDCDAPRDIEASPPNQPLAVEKDVPLLLGPAVVEPGRAKVTPATASPLPAWVLPRRSRQEVLAVWRS
ncbi:MAG: hypothetical protein IPM29_28565 [Planctomycetes bacterium]|nr:hypothetical protein [Planctomycetota bacterium]